MTGTGRVVDPKHLRAIMGRNEWLPPHPYRDNGYRMVSITPVRSIVVSGAPHPDDGVMWLHASIAGGDRLPTYEDFTKLHWAVWGNGWAYQVFAPRADHVNLHPYALHLWGRADGQPVLPNFGEFGTI